MDGSSIAISSHPASASATSSACTIGSNASAVSQRSPSSRPASVYGPGTATFSVGPGGATRRSRSNSSTVPRPRGAASSPDDPVLRALVVRRRAEPARRFALLDPLEEAVEAEVEVEPRLLAVRDDVEARRDLVVDGGDHRVLLELGDVVRPEVGEVRGGVLEPARERVAADHRRAQRRHCHILAP